MKDGSVWQTGEGMDDPDNFSVVKDRSMCVVYGERRVIYQYLIQVEFSEQLVKENFY